MPPARWPRAALPCYRATVVVGCRVGQTVAAADTCLSRHRCVNCDVLLHPTWPTCVDPLQSVKEEISVLAELPLYVREEQAPELYRMSGEDAVEVGPFTVS